MAVPLCVTKLMAYVVDELGRPKLNMALCQVGFPSGMGVCRCNSA